MNLSTNWVLQVDPVVYKSLKKIPRYDAERILAVFEELSADPFSGDIQKMGGEINVWRKRIGSYRIRFDLISESADSSARRRAPAQGTAKDLPRAWSLFMSLKKRGGHSCVRL